MMTHDLIARVGIAYIGAFALLGVILSLTA